MQRFIKLRVQTLNLERVLFTLGLVCIVGLKVLFFPLLLTGEEDGNREAGESEMDGQGEKSRHAAMGPEEWDGPSKKSMSITLQDGLSGVI